MSETISMTDILLTVSVGCNLWFLFLLLYDRIMETRLVRFLRSIAGLWRSLGGTAAKPETVRETPPADTPDIIGKSRFRMAPTRTTAAIPTQEAATSEKDDLLDEIIDRFGEPPEEVEVLWRVACLRALCRLLHIRGISVKPGELRITFAENAAIDPNALMQLISEQQQYMNFKSGAQAQLIFRTVKLKTDSLTWLEKNLPRLAFD